MSLLKLCVLSKCQIAKCFFDQKTQNQSKEKLKDQARIHPEKNPFKCAMFQSRGSV